MSEARTTMIPNPSWGRAASLVLAVAACAARRPCPAPAPPPAVRPAPPAAPSTQPVCGEATDEERAADARFLADLAETRSYRLGMPVGAAPTPDGSRVSTRSTSRAAA